MVWATLVNYNWLQPLRTKAKKLCKNIKNKTPKWEQIKAASKFDTFYGQLRKQIKAERTRNMR